jgi:hypothetical protein
MAQNVSLEANEWQMVLALIANGPWREANPLMMKIGAQLKAKQANSSAAPEWRMMIRDKDYGPYIPDEEGGHG